MTRSDPPRWIEGEEAPEPLRRLLLTGRAELGTPAQVDALARGLSGMLVPGAGLASPEQPGSLSRVRMPPRGVAFRWLAPFGAATGALALWWASNTFRAPRPSNTALPATALEVSTTPARVVSAMPVAATQDVPPAGSPAPGSPAVTVAADPNEGSSAGHGTVSRGPATRGSVSHPRSGASANEAALLEQARALLSREPARALALTGEHRRRFPHGALAEEREVIAIEALKQLGQERAASDEADAFGTQYQNSVHRQRLQQPPAR